MTSASQPTTTLPRLYAATQCVRDSADATGCRVPAGALVDAAVAQWVRTHGVTVTAHDDDELDLLRFHGVRPVQIVFRCDAHSAPIRRAAELGVARFIVTTGPQIVRLAEYVEHRTYVYLDGDAPVVLGDRSLKVVGLHSDVDECGSPQDWAGAATRLMSRMAQLNSLGSTIRRISLSGGSIDGWLTGGVPPVASIMMEVDAAVRDGCACSHVIKPAVTLSALTAGEGMPAWTPRGRLGHRVPRAVAAAVRTAS